MGWECTDLRADGRIILKYEVLRRTNRVGSGSVNCCRSSPVQSFLVPSPAGLMSIFYCLSALGVVQLGRNNLWLLNRCWPSSAQWCLVQSSTRLMTIFSCLSALGVVQLGRTNRWLLNCCWPLSVQWCLVQSSTRLMTIFSCLTALGALRVIEELD
jgi:hypothetical protein